jgi:hypothetical protein
VREARTSSLLVMMVNIHLLIGREGELYSECKICVRQGKTGIVVPLKVVEEACLCDEVISVPEKLVRLPSPRTDVDRLQTEYIG